MSTFADATSLVIIAHQCGDVVDQGQLLLPGIEALQLLRL